jgi:hypothetical protein
MSFNKGGVLVLVGVFVAMGGQAWGQQFTVAYTDGGSWNSVYAQGFSPSVSPNPNLGLGAGDTVYLDEFSFYKSGNADAAADIRLAIINNIFGNVAGLSTSSPLFVGLSENTVLSTALIPTGSPITFSFDELPLVNGNNYAAVYVNAGLDGSLTPVLVSSLVTNYVETPPGSGSFHPQTNYGTESQFTYATSNFINANEFGQFFNTFAFAGDANFTAVLHAVPEPGAICCLIGAVGLAFIARCREN